MKRLYLGLLFLLTTGCTTSKVTGVKKLFGLVPVPFTGSGAPEAGSAKAMAFEQLAPLVYVAIPLIIAGTFWWWATKGRTGLGKISVGLGVSFLVASVALPEIAGWIGIIAVVAVVGVIAYLLWDRYIKKEEG